MDAETEGHILVVEDDPKVSDAIGSFLRSAGFTVTQVSEGTLALAVARESSCDLVLLDVELPGRSGLDVCREIRRDPDLRALPVVMLTGANDEIDRIIGFELGADDYIGKPFNAREVALRIKSVLRRAAPRPATPDTTLCAGAIALSVGRRSVTVAGAPIALTLKQFELLKALLLARGAAVSRDELLRRVWGYTTADLRTRTLDSHVLQLRRKLGAEAWRIETIERFGYRLTDMSTKPL
jgi:two-component system phosphate regulon response regulator PhoB